MCYPCIKKEVDKRVKPIERTVRRVLDRPSRFLDKKKDKK